jgi:lambda family phage portal protein
MGISDSIGSVFDKIVYTLAPRAGARRIAARKAKELLDSRLANGQSRVASKLRRRSFKQVEPNETRDPRYISDDLEIRSLLEDQLVELQTRAVGLYGDNSIARSAVESRVTYEVGQGIRIKPQVKTRKGSRFLTPENVKEINDALRELIDSLSEHGVDRTKTMSLPMAQRLTVREFANEGECFILLGATPFDKRGAFAGPVSTVMEFISPRRVETPPELYGNTNIRLGIHYGERHGEIQGYYVRRTHPDDAGPNHDAGYDYYPRFDSAGNARMLHIFDPLFAGQSRGLPWLTATLNKILDFDDFFEAEIIAKQIEACFGLIFKIAKDEDDPDSTDLYGMALKAAEEQTPEGQLMESIKPGFIQRIREGDDVTTVDPSRPGANFAPFLEGSLRMIASSAQIPYEILAKNFFRTTFASGRLAILDGQLGFAMRRSILQDLMLTPWYRRVISDKVFADELWGLLPIEEFVQDPDSFSRRKYYCKQMGLIDPEKQIKAFSLGMKDGTLNKADYHEENGSDWEAAEEQRFEERKRLIDANLELETYEAEQRKKKGLPPMQKANSDEDLVLEDETIDPDE